MLRGGRVVTVAASPVAAEAVAVQGSRIAAVGSNAEIDAWVGPATRVIELEGRLLVPGFIEGHGHFLGLGEALTILDLTTAQSWDEIVARVAAAAEAAAPGEWIRGRGWHQEKWSRTPEPAVEGAPVHASLSAVSPDNPVLLTHASGHAAFANARALALAGLDRDSADPQGGELVRDGAGELTGLLRESAQREVGAAFAAARGNRSEEALRAERRRLVELAAAEALRHGVTSFQDAGSSFAVVELLRDLEDERALPLRLYVMLRPSDEDLADPGLGQRLAAVRSVAGDDDYLAVRAIKQVVDGALGSHGAWLLEPYADLARSSGLNLQPLESLRRLAELALEHGYQLNTHAIGDRANREMLDLYEAVARGRTDLRWRIEHAQHLHPDDVPRFARLGVIASMQGVHCTSDGPWVLRRLGEERARNGAYLWRSLLDSGAIVVNGTDVPVEDIDLIAGFHASVTRRQANGEAFFPAQRMTREEALRSYTAAAAYAAFEEDRKGSIEAGKLADLVVLSRDILAVPEDEIRDARADLTIVGGVVRYDAR